MTETNNNQKRDFNAAASGWDEDPKRVKLSADIVAEMARRMTFTMEMDVMDFGCGTGLVTLPVAAEVRRMVGVDASSGMLEKLSAKIACEKLSNVETRLFDLETSDDIADRFHGIISSMALHHIPDIGDLFKRWFEWLHPGGGIAAADLEKEDGGFHPDNTGVFHFGFERPVMITALEAAGFAGISFSEAAVVSRPRENGTVDTYPIFLVTARKPGHA